ncbi:MAG: hypothetical protein MJ198_06750 [Bacteroidales bacterium]|nr:hypothetical protein [Bacteroidales bacterium]
MKRIVFIISILLLSITAMAQVPQKFNYQALVRNGSNELVVNKQVTMQVSILAENQSVVYSETHTATTNENGVVTVVIGNGTTTDDFSTIDWAKGNYYVKSVTDLGGGVRAVSGVSPLLSVPYALYAQKSGNKSVVDMSNYVQKTDLPDLNVYATKSEIPSTEGLAKTAEIESVYAKKSDIKETDLSSYAQKTDLPDMTVYATKSEIPSTESLAKSAEIESTYAKKSDIKETDLSSYAQKTDLPDLTAYATKNEVPSTEGLAKSADVESAYAKKSDLADTSLFARKNAVPSLNGYATKNEIPSTEGLMNSDDLEREYAKKNELKNYDMSVFATKSEMLTEEQLSVYAGKNEIPSLDAYIKANDVEKTYAKKTDIKEPDLTGYYSKAEVEQMIMDIYSETSLNRKHKAVMSGGAVKAAFSVAEGKQVYFSQGNLQYQASTNTWRFAENQYDIIGEDNANISATYDGWIDLFGWGTSGWNSGAIAYLPYSYSHPSNSNSFEDYVPGFMSENNLTGSYANADWGVYNKICNGGNVAGQWRTLTGSEWNYVLSERNDASSLNGSARVNGLAGMILLPDDWSLPEGITFKSGVSKDGYASNIYTVMEWAKMEANGAVFLPAAGYRFGTEIFDVNLNSDDSEAGYWSSSATDISRSFVEFLNFSYDEARASHYGRRDLGYSVRLVRAENEVFVPAVKTGEASNVTGNSLIIAGEVQTTGNAEVTERGFCWSTHINPTVSENKLTVGSALGTFSAEITGLDYETEYYVRAYAVNSAGICYGLSVRVKTLLPEVINSVFSVSADTKVQFSMGNLQYQASTNTWRFAEHQYDMIGVANKNISSTYSGWIDLFGWGTSGYNSKYPYMTSTDNNDYGVVGDSYADIAGTNYDWGVYNKISNGGNAAGQWRTLTYDEWYYLLSERTDASSLKGSATVNGVTGIVLLPDNWTTPAGITFTNGMNGFNSNTYTTSDWSKMEANGAVFLPAAGIRLGTDVNGVGSYGYYWSSSANDNYDAYYLTFYSDGACMYSSGRMYGRSVRLVRGL